MNLYEHTIIAKQGSAKTVTENFTNYKDVNNKTKKNVWVAGRPDMNENDPNKLLTGDNFLFK